MVSINMYKLTWINSIIDVSQDFLCKLMECLEPSGEIANRIKGIDYL